MGVEDINFDSDGHAFSPKASKCVSLRRRLPSASGRSASYVPSAQTEKVQSKRPKGSDRQPRFVYVPHQDLVATQTPKVAKVNGRRLVSTEYEISISVESAAVIFPGLLLIGILIGKLFLPRCLWVCSKVQKSLSQQPESILPMYDEDA